MKLRGCVAEELKLQCDSGPPQSTGSHCDSHGGTWVHMALGLNHSGCCPATGCMGATCSEHVVTSRGPFSGSSQGHVPTSSWPRLTSLSHHGLPLSNPLLLLYLNSTYPPCMDPVSTLTSSKHASPEP